jgi:hypothetical protein
MEGELQHILRSTAVQVEPSEHSGGDQEVGAQCRCTPPLAIGGGEPARNLEIFWGMLEQGGFWANCAGVGGEFSHLEYGAVRRFPMHLEYGAVRRFGCGRVDVRAVHPGARTETSLNHPRPISRSPQSTSTHQIPRSRTHFGVPWRGWGHMTGGVASLDPRLMSVAPFGACFGGRFARSRSAVW